MPFKANKRKINDFSPVQLKLENVTTGTGNDTVNITDEFVLFEETGLTVSFGPNQTANDAYDCKSTSVHRVNCDVDEILWVKEYYLGFRSFIWVKEFYFGLGEYIVSNLFIFDEY